MSEDCRKQSYPGEREARNALRRLRLQTRINPGKRRKHKETRVYRCDLCRRWHLTSKRRPDGH